MSADVKGDGDKSLLEKNAAFTFGHIKSGTGQYFALRALIGDMVHAITPSPSERLLLLSNLRR